MRNMMALLFMTVFVSGCMGASFNQQGVRDSKFARMDRDQNAFLSAAELQAYQADEFSKMDNDRNGKVSEEEYAAYYNASR